MWTRERRGNYAVLERKSRINKILSILKTAKDGKIEVSLQKFRAELSINFGISSRKVTEYLQELENAKLIYIGLNEQGEEIIEHLEQEAEKI